MDWIELTRLPASANDKVDVTDAGGRAQPLTAATAVAVLGIGGGLCVPDVYALVRSVAGDDSGVVRDLCALATQNRLLCRTVARRLGCGSGRPPDVLAGLAVSNVPADVVNRHGPGGVFAATRGALALGAASAAGLALDRRAVNEAVDVCQRIADERFARLLGHPDAARMFRDEERTAADGDGFRPTRRAVMREWLGGQLTTVTDRLRLPVPTPVARDRDTDVQVRFWPNWAVGTQSLADLADLQDAEHLGHDLRRGLTAPSRVRPTYYNPHTAISSNPDLGAYRRLHAAGLSPCFVRPEGKTFVRVDLSGLPLAVLCVPTAPALAEELAKDTGVELTIEHANALTALVASGASDATVAVGVGRLARFMITRDQARVLVWALAARLPAVADYLRDPTPDRLVRHTRAETSELLEWTGHTPPVPGGEGSLLRAFLESEQLTDEFLMIGPDHDELLARLRRRFVRPYTGRLPSAVIDLRRLGYRFLERERVLTRSGEVIPRDTWVQARAAFAESVHQVVLGAAFALVAAGHRVVAVTPSEVLVETPQKKDVCGAIGTTVASAVAQFGGGGYTLPSPEVVDRW